MRRLRRLVSIARWILGRRRAEADLDRELRAYVEMSADDGVAGGLTPDEADRLARADLGGLETARERVRTGRHGWRLDEIARDVRHAWRRLVRAPGYAAVVLVTLALGIGANTAIFSLIDALMLRPLAARDPGALGLVSLRARGATASATSDLSLSYRLIRALDAQHGIVESVGGFGTFLFDVGEPGSVERIPGAVVTGGFFDTLGLAPGAGRLLTRGDDDPGAPLAAVVSDEYWDRRFHRSPAAIGAVIAVNGVPVTVVGVTAPPFQGVEVGQRADVVLPVSSIAVVRPARSSLLDPGTAWLRALARPAPGLSRVEAASRLNAIWPALSSDVMPARWPAPRRREMVESTFALEPGGRGFTSLREVYDRPLLILQAVAGVVLLLACVNVASLSLARVEGRRRELALRLAIGASRARVVRELLIESLLVSAGGAVAGVGVAAASVRVWVTVIASGPFGAAFGLAPTIHVALFAAGLAVATGLLFGLAPAFQLRDARPSRALSDDVRTSTGRSRLLPALVVTQVALSAVLVGGAGLLVRTLRNLDRVDRGFSVDGVVVLRLDQAPPASLVDHVRHVSGVVAATVATQTPLDGSSWTEPLVPVGQRVPDDDNTRVVGIDAGYFTTLRVPIVAGRAPADGDRTGPPVAVITERYARQHFPAGNAIGQRLTGVLMGKPAQLEVIGVARDTALAGLREPPPPIVYVPFDRTAIRAFPIAPTLAVRVRDDSPAALEDVRRVVQADLPAWPVSLTPLDAQVRSTILEERLVATLASGFGVLATVLASVGLYGMLAFRVSRRRREIGIRMALGASGRGVRLMVIGAGLRLVGVGMAIGLPLTWVAGRFVSVLLFGLTPADPAAMAGAAVVLLSAATLASFVPARRASRVDPIRALRSE